MNPRLDELLYQRALLAAHLAWLDQEIAKVSLPSNEPVRQPAPPPTYSAPPAPLAPVQAQAPQPQPSAAPPVMEESPEEIAETILSKYRAPASTTVSQTKRNVLLIFTAFMAVVGACVLAFYFMEKSRLGR